MIVFLHHKVSHVHKRENSVTSSFSNYKYVTNQTKTWCVFHLEGFHPLPNTSDYFSNAIFAFRRTSYFIQCDSKPNFKGHSRGVACLSRNSHISKVLKDFQMRTERKKTAYALFCQLRCCHKYDPWKVIHCCICTNLRRV